LLQMGPSRPGQVRKMQVGQEKGNMAEVGGSCP
jgi:hypothetical protein